MDLERECVSEESIGSLRNCLVEGDAEFEQCARKGRRRALVLSIAFQTIIVAALVLFPLLSKGEHLLEKIFVERVPYKLGSRTPSIGDTAQHHSPSSNRLIFDQFMPTGRVVNRTPTSDGLAGDPIQGPGDGPQGDQNGIRDGILNTQHEPLPPQEERIREESKRIIIGHIEPAMLTHRIEPVYPPLAVQLHREGRVELHAIIAEDGSIQELEVISGDPLLIHSALAAVREWQYKPTILDGKPVQVDTHITVVYTLSR